MSFEASDHETRIQPSSANCRQVKSFTGKSQVFTFFCSYNPLARRNKQLPHAFPKRSPDPLTPNELVNEVLKLQRVVGIVYCVRRSAPDIYKELKATGIPVLHIVKDLLSKRKSKDERVLRSFSKLHLRPFFEIKTLTIVRKYGSNLKTIIKKKQSPSQKQRRKNQSLKSI